MSLVIQGQRVVLRDWRDSDLPAWIAINQDPAVRRYFPTIPTAAEAQGEFERIREHAAREGFTFWAVEIPGVTELAGMTGLLRNAMAAHFTPCVEVGWRLGQAFWGQGYATEAARLSLDYAFNTLKLDEVVAMTARLNLPSQKVMQRLGMHTTAQDDFAHPKVDAASPLQDHVLYRMQRTL